MTFTRRNVLGLGATLAGASMLRGVPALAQGEPIKVGVLHSLSGTMAISETTLKDTVEMLIEQQNEAGGLLGCQIEAVVVDPASDWPLFAEKARELITDEEVDADDVEALESRLEKIRSDRNAKAKKLEELKATYEEETSDLQSRLDKALNESDQHRRRAENNDKAYKITQRQLDSANELMKHAVQWVESEHSS